NQPRERRRRRVNRDGWKPTITALAATPTLKENGDDDGDGRELQWLPEKTGITTSTGLKTVVRSKVTRRTTAREATL
ncbi:hypothetical protein A2U01_0060483, partial [Trifolium medium]|nr:hypothetical protein [Trifolium medium]